jgi:hypothetical protein
MFLFISQATPEGFSVIRMCTNTKIIHASDMSLLQDNQRELLLRNGFKAAGIHQFHSNTDQQAG